MPMRSEHAARLRDPKRYKTFRRQNDKGGEGVDFVFGITEDGTAELQAVRFDRERFTPEQAREWLKNHDMKPLMVEPAKGSGKRPAAMVENRGPLFALDHVTTNLSSQARTRYEELDGRRYLVAPMIMLTEGVHQGSHGPLYYPPEELAKYPGVWNTKPIVVYHPQVNGLGVSACSPDILSSCAVGMIMGARYEDGKLKAEAWLDDEKIDRVDPRIREFIQNGRMMEISTGLFTDKQPQTGEWRGKQYQFVARNFRPDHLALLPDQVGACSIKDGAGLLRNSRQGDEDDQGGLAANAASFGQIRDALGAALKGRFGPRVYIEEVYPRSVIFCRCMDYGPVAQDAESKAPEYYRLGYAADRRGAVTLANDAPEEVLRVTEYKTKAGEYVANGYVPVRDAWGWEPVGSRLNKLLATAGSGRDIRLPNAYFDAAAGQWITLPVTNKFGSYGAQKAFFAKLHAGKIKGGKAKGKAGAKGGGGGKSGGPQGAPPPDKNGREMKPGDAKQGQWVATPKGDRGLIDHVYDDVPQTGKGRLVQVDLGAKKVNYREADLKRSKDQKSKWVDKSREDSSGGGGPQGAPPKGQGGIPNHPAHQLKGPKSQKQVAELDELAAKGDWRSLANYNMLGASPQVRDYKAKLLAKADRSEAAFREATQPQGAAAGKDTPSTPLSEQAIREQAMREMKITRKDLLKGGRVVGDLRRHMEKIRKASAKVGGPVGGGIAPKPRTPAEAKAEQARTREITGASKLSLSISSPGIDPKYVTGGGKTNTTAAQAGANATSSPVKLPKNPKKLNIPEAAAALEGMGLKLGRADTDLKTKMTSYQVTGPGGRTTVMSAEKIRDLVYSNPSPSSGGIVAAPKSAPGAPRQTKTDISEAAIDKGGIAGRRPLGRTTVKPGGAAAATPNASQLAAKTGGSLASAGQVRSSAKRGNATPIRAGRVTENQFRFPETALATNAAAGSPTPGVSPMPMTKRDMADRLILNAATAWDEEDREFLESLNPHHLERLVANAADEDGGFDDDDGGEAEENPATEGDTDPSPDDPNQPGGPLQPDGHTPGKNKDNDMVKDAPAEGTTQNAEQYIASAPEGIREVLAAGYQAYRGQKKLLVDSIVANQASRRLVKRFNREFLETQDLEMLQALAEMAEAGPKPQAKQPTANAAPPMFFGAAAPPPVTNAAKQTPLLPPKMEFDPVH